MGRSSSASVRCGAGRGLARPDPPNSTGTRCDALAAGVADMGFSFGEKGERPTLAGTGVPVWVCLADAKRLGTGHEDRWVEGPVPRGKGPCSLAYRGEAVRHRGRSARTPTATLGCRSSHPSRSRGTQGQVTTATPAGLDFDTAVAARKALWTRCPWEAFSVWNSWTPKNLVRRHCHPQLQG